MLCRKRYEYTWDNKQKLTSEDNYQYSENGKHTYKSFKSYGGSNNPLKTYEYDENGNVIKYSVFYNGVSTDRHFVATFEYVKLSDYTPPQEIPQVVTSKKEDSTEKAAQNGGAKSTLVESRKNSEFSYGVYSDCVKITGYNGAGGKVVIPTSIDGLPVASIGNIFRANVSITEISIPDGILTIIDDEMFNGCQNLVSVNIPNGVTSIGQAAFYNCDSLQSITIPNRVSASHRISRWS